MNMFAEDCLWVVWLHWLEGLGNNKATRIFFVVLSKWYKLLLRKITIDCYKNGTALSITMYMYRSTQVLVSTGSITSSTSQYTTVSIIQKLIWSVSNLLCNVVWNIIIHRRQLYKQVCLSLIMLYERNRCINVTNNDCKSNQLWLV